MEDPNKVEVEFDVSELKDVTDGHRRSIFLELQANPTPAVALKYGFDKKYKNMNQAQASVYYIYKQVCKDPERYGLTSSIVDSVREAMENRKPGKNMKKILLDEREKTNFIKDELGEIRDTTAKIMGLKLKKALDSPKERAKLSLKELGGVLAMTIDKGRLLGGQSTENVLHYAKVAKDVAPAEALEIVLKAREALIEKKQS